MFYSFDYCTLLGCQNVYVFIYPPLLACKGLAIGFNFVFYFVLTAQLIFCILHVLMLLPPTNSVLQC